jgi:hypothetical protein
MSEMRRILFPLLMLAGCGSTSSTSDFNNKPPDLGGDDGGTTGPLGEGGAMDCTEAAKLVYVVDDTRTLHSFDPASLTFKAIGKPPLNCPTLANDFPNSMAVQRDGTAWVNYESGALFRVSTADGTCTATKFVPSQHGFKNFGMAFSTDSTDGGSGAEALYVAGIVTYADRRPPTGLGLAKIDLDTLTLTPIGDFSGSLAGLPAELTGTGDGRLFGFFTTDPATLAEIDKTTGATSTPKPLSGVATGTAWAFSFWGGDFWFYTASYPATSDVTRLKYATDNSLGNVLSQIGFRIDGAGVSTCAPTTPTH